MNDTQQFLEAGTLMLAGMVFVFAFLGMLIIFINTVLVKLSVRFPDPVVKSSPRTNKVNKSKAHGDISPSIVAAIGSAVNSYRAQHGKGK